MDARIERILAARERCEAENLGRSGAEVLRSGDVFLKIAPAGALERAAILQKYFHEKGLSAPLIAFDRDAQRDYLLVEAVRGKSGVEWLDRPQQLAARLGEAVRALHELDASDCPIRNVNEAALSLYEREKGRAFGAESSILQKDALVHGDCCLPNVFFRESGFGGWIDLGEGGLGDRHFDLYWAMWSLKYNLKTEKYSEVFLDAYGRDAVDALRLNVCARLSGEDV